MTDAVTILGLCESPIEKKLAETLAPLFHAGVTWEPQRPITVGGQNFRADFYVECAGRRAVIETDGKEWHEYWEDRTRDCLMLHHGAVDDVYRVRGCDIVFDMPGCVHFFTTFAPHWFDAARVPLTVTEKALASCPMKGMPHKPIHRTRAAVTELEDFPASLANLETVNVVGRTEDRSAVVFNFQTPYWDRKYNGSKLWELGDLLRLNAERLMEPDTFPAPVDEAGRPKRFRGNPNRRK